MILIGSIVQIELCNFHLANWIWLMHTQTVHWIWLDRVDVWCIFMRNNLGGEKWMLSVMVLGALWGSSPRPSDFIMAKIFLLPQYGQGGLNKKTKPWTEDYHSNKGNIVCLNENSLKSDPFGKKQIFQKYSTNTAAQSVRTEQKNSLYISGQVRILWTVNDMAGKDPLWGQVVFPCHIIDCS